MTNLDTQTLERLVKEITLAIIEHTQRPLTFQSDTATSPQSVEACCADCEGQCVQRAPDKASAVIEAGASRLSAHLGINHIAQNLAHYIDHTLLKPDATIEQITQLCHEALKHSFATVCVNPSYVKLAALLLNGSPAKVCTVVGFPLGATSPEVKSYEAQQALADGASEIDMVINIGALKSGNNNLVERDIAMVTETSHRGGAICKVILETAMLTDSEKITACQLAKKAGADFVKTSTGFGGGGATIQDVMLMRQTVGPDMGVKASGGIRGLADAKNMLAAGATRLGASAGVKIVQEAQG